MNKVLADTNIWVAYFRGEEPIASEMAGLVVGEELVVSVVVMAEFLVGATKRERQEFEALVGEIGVIDVNWQIASLAADLRRKFLRKKKKVLLLDCLVAATAKLVGAELWTLDRKDFNFALVKMKS